jgi:hypothetical protein
MVLLKYASDATLLTNINSQKEAEINEIQFTLNED